MLKQSILIVDDDPDILEVLEVYLTNEDFDVTTAKDGIEALGKLSESHQLILLDVMMPKMDGLRTCIEIRKKCNIPIIFLTAKVQDTDQILGLQVGADDYIKKPFTPPLLLAKIKATLRRYQQLGSTAITNQKIIQIGDLQIDERAYKVTINKKDVQFTKTEFEILLLLAKYRGQIFSIQRIYESVWGEDYYEDSANTVMVHIKRLRKKLNTYAIHQDMIQTVWGVGYKID